MRQANEMCAGGDWPFGEARDQIAFTTKRIVAGGPVLAIHHEPDGVWQFVDDGPFEVADAATAHLGHFVDNHPWVAEFADLPEGWMAWRSKVGAEWQREIAPIGTES